MIRRSHDHHYTRSLLVVHGEDPGGDAPSVASVASSFTASRDSTLQRFSKTSQQLRVS